MKNKTIKVVGRIVELTKRVKQKNKMTGNVSISEFEKNLIITSDMIILKVLNNGFNIKEIFLTGEEFHQGLKVRSKRMKSGNVVKFYTLRYNHGKNNT